MNKTECFPMKDTRTCAYQKTVVALRSSFPNMSVMTYDNVIARGGEHILLAKFVVGVGDEEPIWMTFDECDEKTKCDNINGGLKSVALSNDGTSIITEIYPLLIGSDCNTWEGGAVIKITCQQNKRLWVKLGNGNISSMHIYPNAETNDDRINCDNGNSIIENDTIYITCKNRNIITAVKGNFDFTCHKLVETDTDFGTYIIGRANEESVFLTVGFCANKNKAGEIAALDAQMEVGKINEYYSKKLKNWYIDTPSDVLNRAFMHGLLNVEYSWLSPLGWIESIQHWPTMWHMEHTATEEWAGNADRTKECLTTQMENLFESGAVPDMCPNGKPRRDWGGNNQFFFREMEHYIKMTGDIDFARKAEPFLCKILSQTFAEYDPTHKGILAWGTQIGNQEDFEATPGKGAATGSEGIKMLEIMVFIKGLLGKDKEAEKYKTYSEYCRQQLIKLLWQKDIGRFTWYEDVNGTKRMETTYHGIAYPVIYNQIDDMDKISSLDHMKNRLSGKEGEVYLTNHFAEHANWFGPTWGMQCGSDMQPFAAAAFAEAGMNNDAIRPLDYIAKRVCGEFQRGAWPETANEDRIAYFSPSAAVFTQSVIENIFGIKMDRINNIMTISPCFPDRWEYAEIKVNGVYMQYTKQSGRHIFLIKTDNSLKKLFKWKLPPYFEAAVYVDGEIADVTTVARCGYFDAEVQLGASAAVKLEFEYTKLSYTCNYEKSVCCGDDFNLTTSGAEIIGIDDRCGIFKCIQIHDNSISAIVNKNLLDDYMKYGMLGMINFARRTFALKILVGGKTFYHPCHITIMPAFLSESKYIDGNVNVNVRNNTKRIIIGRAILEISGMIHSVNICIAAESECVLSLMLSEYSKSQLSPGKNNARMYIICDNETVCLDVIVDATSITGVNVVSIPFDESQIVPAEYWKTIAYPPTHGHMMLAGSGTFMNGLFAKHDRIKILEGVPLMLNPNGFIPFSTKFHRIVDIPLNNIKAKKLYVLLCAFIDNHDVYSTPFNIEVIGAQKDSFIKPIYKYDLTYPGELDMGYGNPVIAGFATFINETERHGILKTIKAPYLCADGDYEIAMPPDYPGRKLWCHNRAIDVCDTVFNLIEIDFERMVELETLRIISNGSDAAGGVFAIAAHCL